MIFLGQGKIFVTQGQYGCDACNTYGRACFQVMAYADWLLRGPFRHCEKRIALPGAVIGQYAFFPTGKFWRENFWTDLDENKSITYDSMETFEQHILEHSRCFSWKLYIYKRGKWMPNGWKHKKAI